MTKIFSGDLHEIIDFQYEQNKIKNFNFKDIKKKKGQWKADPSVIDYHY